MGGFWSCTVHGNMAPTWKTAHTPHETHNTCIDKDPFSGCNYDFFPTPMTTNPFPVDTLESTTSYPWPEVGPYPLSDLCPGSPGGKRSWLFFFPLNYSHPNLGHWH